MGICMLFPQMSNESAIRGVAIAPYRPKNNQRIVDGMVMVSLREMPILKLESVVRRDRHSYRQ